MPTARVRVKESAGSRLTFRSQSSFLGKFTSLNLPSRSVNDTTWVPVDTENVPVLATPSGFHPVHVVDVTQGIATLYADLSQSY